MPSAISIPTANTEAHYEDVAALAESPTATQPLLSKSREIVTTTKGTVLYLAYGSNLCAATFLGVRKIKPLSSQVVHVPSLNLTFDLPGVPYAEPCFANSRYRDPNAVPGKSPYRKDRWHKGMIGVVYEVTVDDYRKIIASEGGGMGYKDVLVDCYRLPAAVESLEVGLAKDGKAFKAHTLLAPGKGDGNGEHRNDGSYSQPSARYLGLITTGAEEQSLPSDYMDYLKSIRPYTVTTWRQRIGKLVFAGLWWTILVILFTFGKAISNKKGIVPEWFAKITLGVMGALWKVYDYGVKQVFGDGERTIGD